MRTRGYISYPAGQLERIISSGSTSGSTSRGEAGADPGDYKVRMVMTLRTEDDRYADKVNLGLWMGSAVWVGRDLILECVPPFPSSLLPFPLLRRRGMPFANLC